MPTFLNSSVNNINNNKSNMKETFTRIVCDIGTTAFRLQPKVSRIIASSKPASANQFFTSVFVHPKAPIPVQFSTILYQSALRPTVFPHAWTCCPLILRCRLLMRPTDRNSPDAPETGTFVISLYKERDPPRPAHVQLCCRSICSARSISCLRIQTSGVNGDNRREENGVGEHLKGGKVWK